MEIDLIVGGTWHAPQLASALTELGASVRVITTNHRAWGRDYEVLNIPMDLVLKGSRRCALLAPVATEAFGALACRHLRESAAVIAWSSFAGPVCRKRMTMVVRGSTHIETQRMTLKGNVRPILDGPAHSAVVAERWEYRHAEDVTVPTRLIADDPQWNGDGVRPVVAPYGFDCGVCEDNRESDHLVGRVVTAGEISYRKGYDRLALALSEPSREVTEVVVAGKGRSGLTLPSWWTSIGLLSHREWHRMLGASGVFVLLSREEGMARVGLEAMLEGTPIVVTKETGLGEWADAGAGVVVSGNPVDVCRAISTVQQDWASFHRAAKEISRSWTWRDHAQILLNRMKQY